MPATIEETVSNHDSNGVDCGLWENLFLQREPREEPANQDGEHGEVRRNVVVTEPFDHPVHCVA